MKYSTAYIDVLQTTTNQNLSSAFGIKYQHTQVAPPMFRGLPIFQYHCKSSCKWYSKDVQIGYSCKKERIILS
ncbi:unnamed protein product [Callosobruchus maculatus]|uniref:Uncharacterized protein n=1 Tax=Callosobruchus maculatus TaxID=64391 RepID=A0A653CBP0_CALMS|nr:unnamed protein product [Callosobruchus maculatus]